MSKVVQFRPRKPKPEPKPAGRGPDRNRQLLAFGGALLLLVVGYLAIDRLMPARAAEPSVATDVAEG